jgi:hypothetical protein
VIVKVCQLTIASITRAEAVSHPFDGGTRGA